MLLHIISKADWAAAQSAGSIAPAGEDFVHCSDRGVVHVTAGKFFHGQSGLLLLVVDPKLLDVPVRWEAVADSPLWFPHVYGQIPVAAVAEVHDFPCEPDGSFILPEAVAAP
ncbi:DUF952 domain-containing protein [Lentzea flaviverrucosa]|uniref:Uncharacterized conserved protein, DUF952 family n=1 Tax=Lentzea flaviverrucosa TaxID=200379 RepID=A0A1H9XV38_9PSEU|nr:DUF952 domain-containing protein [Lentzea flaviverrucosa]RDI18747.1 uncharacterized protein (DUF952 family) [Lentzea flaviverrucosa]SES49964.1 Uncharacterized conserved protein, DUF952 family [Lentzea flaviverrucosa]